MFRTIVVGVDGRDSGEDAIALARRLAAGDAELILSEIVVPRRFGARDGDPAALDAARERLDARCAQIDGVRTGAQALTADAVATGLEEVAAAHDADLVVVGSSAHSGLGRLLTGDDTRGVLHHAQRPVAIAPAGFAADGGAPVTHIGVGFNESAESERALELALAMREQHHARLEVMEILPPPWPIDMAWSGIPTLHEERKRAEAKLMETPGIDASKVLVAASAYGELRELATRSSLLVIGARPLSAFGRFALGSTSDALSHDLPCALLVVPRVPVSAPHLAPAG
jgi:nucleotide-binding universal stress UspA family protein